MALLLLLTLLLMMLLLLSDCGEEGRRRRQRATRVSGVRRSRRRLDANETGIGMTRNGRSAPECERRWEGHLVCGEAAMMDWWHRGTVKGGDGVGEVLTQQWTDRGSG
ncbi:unnamed protein product [Lampetra fluviatilis]